MTYRIEEMEVLSQEQVAYQIFVMRLRSKKVSRLRGDIVAIMRPGQFINIRIPRADLGLRRPISISEVFPESSECSIVYRVEGDGTAAMSRLQAGDTLDVLGPLGRGFPIDAPSQPESIRLDPTAQFGAPSTNKSNECAFIIGGGIGVPPLLEVAKQMHERGAKVYAFLGFATEDAIFYEEEFSRYAEVMVSTDDGSYGFKGNAMQTLQTVLDRGVSPDAVYSCGPTPLLRAVDAKFAGHGAAYVSLEARMACGIGACYACVCHVAGDETGTLAKKICDQGPVFRCGEVVF